MSNYPGKCAVNGRMVADPIINVNIKVSDYPSYTLVHIVIVVAVVAVVVKADVVVIVTIVTIIIVIILTS